MMQQSRRLTAIIEREGNGYVALCPELDVASQGGSLEEARSNLIQALTLFFETADATEIVQRFHSDLFVTQVEARLDELSAIPYIDRKNQVRWLRGGGA